MKAFKDSLKINFDFGNMEEFVSQAINVWWNKFKSLSLTWEDWKTFEQKSTNILFFFHVSDFDRQGNYDLVESAQNY